MGPVGDGGVGGRMGGVLLRGAGAVHPCRTGELLAAADARHLFGGRDNGRQQRRKKTVVCNGMGGGQRKGDFLRECVREGAIQ